ncbi:MAG: hypothetical protein Rhims3KO_24310 [Hyphomicrobiales bacterium]
MKTLALTATAFAIALGSASAPAFAESSGNADLYDYTANIVAVDRAAGTINLSSGQTLDQSIEAFAFPVQARVGDKVLVDIDGDDLTLKGVRVLR